MSDEAKPEGFVVCRIGSDPLKPGYVLGYKCAICARELQVSPSGIRALNGEMRLILLCNACGFAMYDRLKAAGKDLQEIYSPEFMQSVKNLVEKGSTE